MGFFDRFSSDVKLTPAIALGLPSDVNNKMVQLMVRISDDGG